MRSRALAASLAALLVLLLAGCGGEDEEGSSPGATTSTFPIDKTDPPVSVTSSVPEESPAVVTLYFLRDGKLGVAARGVVTGPQIGSAAMKELLEGPTGADRAAGLSSAIPAGTELERLAIESGVARVELSKSLDEPATAQVVHTLSAFPTVRRVELEGEQHVRSDFEELTPAILVESPRPGEQVSTPLRLSGTANTFEATFQAEVVDATGRVLGKRFVTATSGSGTRGTFDAALPFRGKGGAGKLVVYELSAEDGSRMNQVEIPLGLSPS
jgi:germination protein M